MISNEQFKPLTEIKNVELFGLLKGVEGKRCWPTGIVNTFEGIENFPMTNLANKINDYSDLAHYINHLDLVITVDTGLAHLAAAMGKEVWLMNRFDTCWRWLETRGTTDWYPSFMIYRQKEFMNWDNVIRAIKRDLDELAK